MKKIINAVIYTEIAMLGTFGTLAAAMLDLSGHTIISKVVALGIIGFALAIRNRLRRVPA